MIKGLLSAFATGPLLYLAASAVPELPGHWEFARLAAIGAFFGCFARVWVSLHKAELRSPRAGFYLGMTSFSLGICGAYLSYFAGLIDGHDPIKVTGAAAGCALFGILLEAIAQKGIKARGKAAINEIRSGSTADYDTDRAADFYRALAEEKAKKNADEPL